MSDQENFLTRWSRRKRDAPAAAQPAGRSRASRRRKARRTLNRLPRARPKPNAPPAVGIRPDEAALARIDRRQYRHPSPSCKPACRPRSGMRRFVARGRPIRRSATSLGWRRTPGTSPIPTPCRGSASSIRASTSRSLSPRFSAKARRKPKRRRIRRFRTGAAQSAAPDKSNTSGWRCGYERAASGRTAKARSTRKRSMLQRDENIATQQIDSADEPRRP